MREEMFCGSFQTLRHTRGGQRRDNASFGVEKVVQVHAQSAIRLSEPKRMLLHTWYAPFLNRFRVVHA
jgi:hypothetical protein